MAENAEQELWTHVPWRRWLCMDAGSSVGFTPGSANRISLMEYFANGMEKGLSESG